MYLWRSEGPAAIHFLRALKKLPVQVKLLAATRELIFRKDCFDSRLETHKLGGKYKEHWAFSIDYHYRIMFRFLSDTEVLFEDTDNHKIYR